MQKRTTATALALAASVLLTAALPAQAKAGSSGSSGSSGFYGFYGTKTTYAPQQDLRTYEQAPKGFAPVFTETVSRHGSRAASDSEDGDRILALWERARSEGQLTRTGEGR
uniref:Uncharacterized protein n=1 Tax=Streptomyces sp. NBC_01401 TaxID=2903854 RepID=A0AAU3H2N7_9ACTN